MAISQLAEPILEIIGKHKGSYPIFTLEIQKQLGCANAVLNSELKKLRKAGKILSKKATWIKGYKVFHILTGQNWPNFLSTTCGNCHYKSTIKTCIFHNELHEQGFSCDLTRVGVKLSSKTVGCPYYISRVTHWKKKPLEEFLNLSASKGRENEKVHESTLINTNQDDDFFFEENVSAHLLPRYYCVFCSYILHQLGCGFLPLLGSSVIRCQNCESLYKLVYDEKEEKFMVLYAEERGDLFRHNFEQITSTASRFEPYSSNNFGIVIPKEGHYDLDKVAEVLIIDNWMGKLSVLDYIVTKSKKDYHDLKKALVEDYPQISIIDGEELLVSPKPNTEQIGILQLLKETKLLNASFCRATLESRKTVLSLLVGIVNEEKRLKVIAVINKQLRLLSRYQLLDVKHWNKLDMTAANAMWLPIEEFLKGEGIDFPGRGLGRYVRDPFKPYRLYYGYSAIDTIINGLMLKTSEVVKEYCSKINFCWDGLPGICHKETHGGEFGFHLDLIEPFKLIALSILCKIVLEKSIGLENIQFIIGRRRQKIFFVNPQSELNEQLKELHDTAFNQKGKKLPVKHELENYFFQVKLWMQRLVERSYVHRIIHHDQSFTFWAVMYYKLWQFLNDEQKQNIINAITKLIQTSSFEPYAFQIVN